MGHETSFETETRCRDSITCCYTFSFGFVYFTYFAETDGKCDVDLSACVLSIIGLHGYL